MANESRPLSAKDQRWFDATQRQINYLPSGLRLRVDPSDDGRIYVMRGETMIECIEMDRLEVKSL